jgi:[histone H3]-trimethyl-L-lysine9/36 demethylase
MFRFCRPIRQHATGRQGLYRTLLVENRSMPLQNFKDMTEEPTNAPPNLEPDELERKFWRNVPMNPPLYGADVPGSLFDERIRGWTLRRLPSLLSRTLEEAGAEIPGVTQPYLYAGSWRSFFAWHTEDLDLHSVNYLHCGAPKTWYVIPPHARERFELLARDLLPELHRYCPEFLRHKEILLSPALLAAHNIPVVKTVHREREFVVVGPGAYHAGFNHGYNLAESVNFATPSWVPVGAQASFCTCRPDSVKIDMRLFADYMDPELAKEVMESYSSDEEEEEVEEEDHDEDIHEEGEKMRGVVEAHAVDKKVRGRKAGQRRRGAKQMRGKKSRIAIHDRSQDDDSSSNEQSSIISGGGDDEDDESGSHGTDSEDDSDDQGEESDAEKEALPAKRVRRPTAKAAASDLQVYAAAATRQHPPSPPLPPPLQRLNGRPAKVTAAVTKAPSRHDTAATAAAAAEEEELQQQLLRNSSGINAPVSLAARQRHMREALRRHRRPPALAAAATASRPLSKQPSNAAALSRGKTRRPSQGLEKQAHVAAAAEALVRGDSSSSFSQGDDDHEEEDEYGDADAAGGDVASGDGGMEGIGRPTSKRVAARAWYALFDTLLPSLKRARS